MNASQSIIKQSAANRDKNWSTILENIIPQEISSHTVCNSGMAAKLCSKEKGGTFDMMKEGGRDEILRINSIFDPSFRPHSFLSLTHTAVIHNGFHVLQTPLLIGQGRRLDRLAACGRRWRNTDETNEKHYWILWIFTASF